MSKVCSSCGRGGMIVQWRSHSNISTRHKQQINLQKSRIDGKQVRVCARCLKNNKHEKLEAKKIPA